MCAVIEDMDPTKHTIWEAINMRQDFLAHRFLFIIFQPGALNFHGHMQISIGRETFQNPTLRAQKIIFTPRFLQAKSALEIWKGHGSVTRRKDAAA